MPATLVMPLVTIDEAENAWKTYQELCRRLLDDNEDYVTIKGKKAKKRSAYQKLARFTE